MKLQDICPGCNKRAFVGGIELVHNGDKVEICVYFFCDRTKGCETAQRELFGNRDWVQSQTIKRVGVQSGTWNYQDAIRRARGGDAPAGVQGFA